MNDRRVSERKLPRLDLRKLVAGGVAGRRESLAIAGDALREDGGVRVEGHGADARTPAALGLVADRLLEALAEYFGLPATSFAAAATTALPSLDAGGTAAALERALLVVLLDVPASAEVRGAGGRWTTVGARAGELLVLPGGALTVLTGGVVPSTAVRWRVGESAPLVEVAAPAGASLEPLAAFTEAGGS